MLWLDHQKNSKVVFAIFIGIFGALLICLGLANIIAGTMFATRDLPDSFQVPKDGKGTWTGCIHMLSGITMLGAVYYNLKRQKRKFVFLVIIISIIGGSIALYEASVCGIQRREWESRTGIGFRCIKRSRDECAQYECTKDGNDLTGKECDDAKFTDNILAALMAMDAAAGGLNVWSLIFCCIFCCTAEFEE